MSAAEQLDPMYTAAAQYAMRGLRVFPTESHGHRPTIVGWPDRATNDAVAIDEWFKDRDVNLALCCGPQVKGWTLLAVDIDPPNGGQETYERLRDQFGWSLTGVPVHQTPSGGRHLFYTVPDDLCLTGTDVLGPGIDLRGGRMVDGDRVGSGFVMLPPSIRPSKVSGELVSYGERPGQGLLHVDPPPAPEWLLGLLRRYLAPPKAKVAESVARHPSQHTVERDNPWDWVRDNLHWEEVLVRYGWSQKGPFWARPGKTPRQGTGGFLHDDGRFAIWTPTDIPNGVAELGSRNVDGSYSISLADFITAYEFDGDRQRFGREYRKLMPRDEPVRAAPPEEGEAEAVRQRSSWGTMFDVQAAIDGRLVAPEPTILERADGVALFYPGMVNSVFGAPGKGKGWLCLATAVEQINLSRNVVYIDLEDTLASIVSRLRILGVDDMLIAKHLIYIKPSEPSIGPDHPLDDLFAVCAEHQPSLIIIDSLGQAFGLDGIEENSDAEVNPWFTNVAVRLAETGACVLTIDHSTKSQEYRLFPSGTKRKVAVPAAVYLVEPVREMVKGKGGAVRLVTAKDRHGNHQTNRPAAIVNFIPSGDGLRVVVSPVTDSQFEAETSPVEQHHRVVSELMLRCLGEARRYERSNRGRTWSINRLADYIGGKKTTTVEAIRRLIEHGYCVESETVKGHPAYLVDSDAPATQFDP